MCRLSKNDDDRVVRKSLAKDVPKEMQCLLCSQFLKEAVIVPCCGLSFCDSCECLCQAAVYFLASSKIGTTI